MHGSDVLFQTFIYLTAAVIAVPLARRLGMGSVLGYLVAGIVIGPFGLRFVGDEIQDVLEFAEFGVVMMLFLIGLEMEPARLWRMRSSLIGLGGLQVGLTSALGAAAFMAAGLGWRAAVALGMTVSLSSTAIVLQSLSEKGLLRSQGGQNAFAVLLFQDIAVIPMLAVMPLLAAAPAVEPGPGGARPWGKALIVLGAVAAIALAGRLLVVPLLRIVARARVREMFTASALLLVVATALLMARVGLSPALGTFLAGVVLATSEYRHELETDLEPFKGLLLGLFFLFVGAAIDFGQVMAEPAAVLFLVGALVAGKFLVLAVLGRVFGIGLDQRLLFAVALAQVGEFAFLLLSFAGQRGVLSADVTARATAATALSMALTPILMILHERVIAPRLRRRAGEPREADVIDEDNPVIIAGFGRFGHVVGRLLLANGVGATVLDEDSDHVDLLRRLGLKVFYGDASRVDLLRAAGAGRAKVLVVAVNDPAKGLEIVRAAHEHFPHLKVFARARGRDHAYELVDAGVERIYRETLDTSLRLGTDLLRTLGFRAYQARRAARTFRRHDESSVRELARLRHDRKQYLVRAREQIADLEQTIQDEMAGGTGSPDEGWDTDSLREDPPAGENGQRR